MAIGSVVFLLPLVPLLWWRVSLARDVRQALAQREAVGLPVSRAQLNSRLPDITLEENRATLYYDAQRALQALPPDAGTNLPFHGRSRMPAPELPMAEEMVAAMTVAVQTNVDALLALHEAVNRPAAGLLLRYSADGSTEVFSYLPSYMQLTRLLCYEALLAIENEHWDQGYRSLHAALALTASLEHLGYDDSLRSQWEMERFIIQTLERLLQGPPISEATLAPFVGHFGPHHREAAYRHVLATEQALFVARIREGRDRTLLKGLVLAAGVGDLNIRAYLTAGDHLLRWPDAAFDQRTALERAYEAEKRTWEESPLLYATVLHFSPAAPTELLKEELDRAAVVSVALAATRYRWAKSRAPETVAELVPAHLQSVPDSAVTGEPAALVVGGERSDVVVGTVRFRLAN